jgi:hypothetical protein
MIPSTLLLSLLAISAADDDDPERVQAFIDEEGLPDVRLLQTQLGVHSALHKAGQAQQADTDDVMLFQSHAKSASQDMLEEMSKSKRKNTAELKAMVEKLAAEVSKANTTIDDTTRDALKNMKKTLEDTSEITIRASHAEDQGLLQRHADAVEACGAHFRDNKKEEAAMASDVSSKEMAHTDLRADLKIKKDVRSSHCENLDNLHRSLIPPTCTVPSALDEVEHYLSTIETWSKTNIMTWNELYELCTEATTVYSQQLETSDVKQMYFEGDFCQYRLVLHEDCYTNSMCYDVALAEFEQAKEVALANAESRRLEWTAIQKIKCYVDVLMDDASETSHRQEGMNACQELVPDTEHLNIDVPLLPDKEPCDFSDVVEYPGTTEFVKRYDGMTDVRDTVECAALEDHLVNPTAAVSQLEWKLVFRQTYPHLFSPDEWSKNPGDPTSDNFAILDTLEEFRDSGKFTFRLHWPDSHFEDQVWSQTSNPVTKTSGGVEGYEAIDVRYTDHSWGGLEHDNGGHTLLDGSVDHNWWFYSVGSQTIWSEGIPGPNAPVHKVELYVQAKKAPAVTKPAQATASASSGCTASAGEKCYLKENGAWKPEDIPPYFDCLGNCCQDYDPTRIFDGITCPEILSMGFTCDSEIPRDGSHVPAGTTVSDVCCATCSTQGAAGTAAKPPPATYSSSSGSTWPSTGSSAWSTWPSTGSTWDS